VSIFRLSDYTGQKSQTRYMTKTKIPTQNKTRRHRCSRCHRTDATRYPLNETESRWLCPDCKRRYDAQFSSESKVNFVRASKL
jgi:rubrerythrin